MDIVKNKKIEIYVTTHKLFNKPKMEYYIPIVAGASECDKQLLREYIFDDTGDNISDKHNWYSEFTVLYWMAKNSNANIIGENHYRRYFIRGSWFTYFKSQIFTNNPYKYILTDKDISDIFEKGYNCILTKKMAHYEYTIYEYHCLARKNAKKLYPLVKNIISETCPEYIHAYNIMLASRTGYYKCINIMSKQLFDEMISWSYNILSKLEKFNTMLEERELAYMYERLVNVWILHNINIKKLKIKEQFYINTDCLIGNGKYVRFETVFPLWFAFIFDNLLHNKYIRVIRQLVRKYIDNKNK